MNDQVSLSNIDSLLLQLALQTRELSQKKNELKQQIKVCRANIAERKSYIESMDKKIMKLEEEARVKQSTVTHNKANAKSTRATNGLLLQYEQTLKAELESRKASYSHDMEVYEERITSYRNIFQSHKEYYYKNPVAQELLMLQAENEAIECRIKGYDEQIRIKQKKLEHLTGLAANSSATEKLPDNVFGQQPIPEPEKRLDPLIEKESDSPIGISFLCLNQTKNDHEVSVGKNAGDLHEENKAEDNSHYQEEAYDELCSYKQLNEQSDIHQIHTNEPDKETEIHDEVMEQQTTASEMEDPLEHSKSVDEDPALTKENSNTLTAFPQSSFQESNQSTSPAKMKAASSTQPFLFNFSPSSSLSQGKSDGKSPAFLFSLNPEQSTPAFTGFGFDMGSSQDEDTSFIFPSSFFSEKKTIELKSSSCSEFFFEQPQSEDFQFAFTSKSPQAPNKDSAKDDFPFSFNF